MERLTRINLRLDEDEAELVRIASESVGLKPSEFGRFAILAWANRRMDRLGLPFEPSEEIR